MELKLILLIGLVLLVLLMTKPFAKRVANEVDKKIPENKVPNDKIVLIKGAGVSDIKQAVQQFCDLYNKQEDAITIAQVTEIAFNEIAIVFPYDIDFGRFCFFVNYMYYPNNISYKADIRGWATTKPNDMWVADDFAGKKIMLYIPDYNTEYDSLYMTTENNVGYKISFADSGDPKQLFPPLLNFEVQKISAYDVKANSAEEIN